LGDFYDVASIRAATSIKMQRLIFVALMIFYGN